MNPRWLLNTRSPSSFIRRNASSPSLELRSVFHLPMVQRRYVITPPGFGPHVMGTTITELSREAHLMVPASVPPCFSDAFRRVLLKKWASAKYYSRKLRRQEKSRGGYAPALNYDLPSAVALRKVFLHVRVATVRSGAIFRVSRTL